MAVTLDGEVVTNALAQTALDVASVVAADLNEATHSGQTSDIVAAMADVYSGVSRSVVSQVASAGPKPAPPLPPKASSTLLKQKLKSSADNICEALTRNSAPDAPPVGAASSEFAFSCQKVEQRSARSRAVDEHNMVASVCALGVLTKCITNFRDPSM